MGGGGVWICVCRTFLIILCDLWSSILLWTNDAAVYAWGVPPNSAPGIPPQILVVLCEKYQYKSIVWAYKDAPSATTNKMIVVIILLLFLFIIGPRRDFLHYYIILCKKIQSLRRVRGYSAVGFAPKIFRKNSDSFIFIHNPICLWTAIISSFLFTFFKQYLIFMRGTLK